MRAVANDKRSNPIEPLEMLFDALKKRAGSENFIRKAMKSLIEDFNSQNPVDAGSHDVVIGALADRDLINLLAEKIYLETLADACESKISAAKWRHRTVSERFKQMVCDRFDLPDDEPIKVDIDNMRVLKGDREKRIDSLKTEIEQLFEAEEEKLKEIVRTKDEGTLECDMATVLIGDHRQEAIKLCNEIFQATERDREFLEKVMNDGDVPDPISAIAAIIMKERGITCRKEKTIEWR